MEIFNFITTDLKKIPSVFHICYCLKPYFKKWIVLVYSLSTYIALIFRGRPPPPLWHLSNLQRLSTCHNWYVYFLPQPLSGNAEPVKPFDHTIFTFLMEKRGVFSSVDYFFFIRFTTKKKPWYTVDNPFIIADVLLTQSCYTNCHSRKRVAWKRHKKAG